MVYADEQLYGSKATITNAVKYLQNQGKTVLGGTNADFFVMSTGIPIGLVIDSGELISSDALAVRGRLQEGRHSCPRPPDYGASA